MNNTYVSFKNLSGEILTLNSWVNPTLSTDYWGPTASQTIPSSETPVQSLFFSRDTGITNGETWSLASGFEVDGVPVLLEISLTGTLLGSDVKQYLSAGSQSTGWWSSNDSQVLYFTGQSGNMYSVQLSPIVPLPLLTYADFTLTVAKSVLTTNMQLYTGDQLNSPGGLLNMTLEESGLVVYRSMFDYPIWTSPNPDSLVANSAVMQPDGNFVVYDADNTAIWATGTSGNGNSVMLTDNTLTVNTTDQFAPIAWDAGLPAQDWTSDTFQYEENGYSFDETSEYWKQMCQNLPCSMLLQWPDYQTTTFSTVLDGQPVVIQAWRGYCEQFLGSSSFPGGVGGEVGIYTMQPPLQSYSSDSWYPMPYVVASVSFQLINLCNNESVFFESRAENTYWNCKWMSTGSYSNYQQNMGPGNTPPFSDRYQMNIQVTGIDGQTFTVTWPGIV